MSDRRSGGYRGGRPRQPTPPYYIPPPSMPYMYPAPLPPPPAYLNYYGMYGMYAGGAAAPMATAAPSIRRPRLPSCSNQMIRKRPAAIEKEQSSEDDYATDASTEDESQQAQQSSSSKKSKVVAEPPACEKKPTIKPSLVQHPGVTEKQCELCGVVFTSKVLREQHLKGKKHKKKLKFHMDKGGGEGGAFDLPDSGDEAAEPVDDNDGDEDNLDESGDVEMEVLDPHLEFHEELRALKGAILHPENSERISINAFQLFRIMEEYLRFITRRYVSPGIDPTRMSWNELLNVLKRNTIVKLSSNMERKLDNVRQLRNSVVHSFTAPVDIRVLTKVIKIAEEMYEWGVQFREFN